jgi:hypothetical protein
MPAEESLLPPWLQFKGAAPSWSGWRQGHSEDWLLRVWLPFWRSLSDEARERYLQDWPPPDEEWRAYLELWQ